MKFNIEFLVCKKTLHYITAFICWAQDGNRNGPMEVSQGAIEQVILQFSANYVIKLCLNLLHYLGLCFY